jgi:hypothetical protein
LQLNTEASQEGGAYRILKNEAKIGTQGVYFKEFPSLADLVGPVEEKILRVSEVFRKNKKWVCYHPR